MMCAVKDNRIPFSCFAHSVDAYNRLPEGWATTPEKFWTDLHMWRQFLELPGLRARTGTRVTALHLAEQHLAGIPTGERVAELERWCTRAREPGFGAELEREACEAVRSTAVHHEARIQDLKATLSHIQRTRMWRLRTRLASFRPRRAPAA
jgi:hypothetical protein